MLRYFGKRLLVFIPTLVVISLVAFGLSRMTPGDPVECGMQEQNQMTFSSDADRKYLQKIYLEEARRRGLDKPLFYCSFTSAAYPDTLYRIYDRFDRKLLSKLIAQYGNWPQIGGYFSQINVLEEALFALPKDQSRDPQIAVFRNLEQLKNQYHDDQVRGLLEKINTTVREDSLLEAELGSVARQLTAAYGKVKEEATPGRLKIPAFYWYGFDNQYHNWLLRFLGGNFGISCRNGQPVADRIKPALWWTLAMSIPAILLAYFIAVPIGVYAAVKRDSLFDRISTVVLFILYSLPSFWIAIMLIVFFTTKEYGPHMDIFPSVGLGDLSADAPFWDRFWERSAHLILPVFCMMYSALAFISRQMRSGVLNVIGQDYIRTAQAKGLPQNKVIWKHVFRNALFPLITLIALVLPSAIGGAVVIEVIFNIPGMGRETVEAIFARDWPVVYTVLMLAAVLTLLGNLIADLFYALADPRVSFR